jgi:hypothetical protein
MSRLIAGAGLVSALLTSATRAALHAPLSSAVKPVTKTMPRHVRRMNFNKSISREQQGYGRGIRDIFQIS